MKLGNLLVALQKVGIDAGEADALSVNVAREIKISLYPDATEALFLRVVERSKAEQDFSNLQRLNELLGGHIVCPLKVVGGGELACGIFPFVSHARVSYQLISQERYFSQVMDILARLHAGADQFPESQRKFDVQAIFSRLSGEGWSEMLLRYVERLYRPALEARNAVPQHCDFTYVNLGTDDDGTLRVFDWEDFGSDSLRRFRPCDVCLQPSPARGFAVVDDQRPGELRQQDSRGGWGDGAVPSGLHGRTVHGGLSRAPRAVHGAQERNSGTPSIEG